MGEARKCEFPTRSQVMLLAPGRQGEKRILWNENSAESSRSLHWAPTLSWQHATPGGPEPELVPRPTLTVSSPGRGLPLSSWRWTGLEKAWLTPLQYRKPRQTAKFRLSLTLSDNWGCGPTNQSRTEQWTQTPAARHRTQALTHFLGGRCCKNFLDFFFLSLFLKLFLWRSSVGFGPQFEINFEARSSGLPLPVSPNDS